MKKILVTGGTSYIGKHCIAQLVEKEYDVVATIRDISKSESILSDLNQYLNKKQILNIPKLMINDKKNDDDKINLILLKRIGKTTIPGKIKMSVSQVNKFLKKIN